MAPYGSREKLGTVGQAEFVATASQQGLSL